MRGEGCNWVLRLTRRKSASDTRDMMVATSVNYAQWFFCVLGMVIFGLIIFLSLDAHYHWTK